MIDADRIRDAVQDVLSRPGYDELRPSPADRLLGTVRAWLADLLDQIVGTSLGTTAGQVVAGLVVAAVVVVGVVLLRSSRRSGGRDVVVEVGMSVDAAGLVVEADRARAAGDLDAATRRRYAALVLALVEGGVLEARPGTTVGEVGAGVATGAPAAVDAVVAAGLALADVVYGGTPADGGTDDTVAAGLDAVARAMGRGDLRTAAPVGAGPS